MALDDLIEAARRQYRFRDRGSFETADQYRAALVAHVQGHDFAAAHELRVGRPQAAWTPTDVQAFLDSLRGSPRGSAPAPTVAVLLRAALALQPIGQLASTDDPVLLEAAHVTLNAMADMRRNKPTEELPILLHLIHEDGTLLVMSIPRDQRVSLVRALARIVPLAGFFVFSDAFIHGINTATGIATKRDALIAHVGSRRGLRRMLIREYAVRDGRTEFDPTREMDKTTDQAVHDPYADVFAVPAAAGTH